MRTMRLGAALALAMAAMSMPAVTQDAPAQAVRYHEDERARDLEGALLDATLAAVRDDLVALGEAFRRIESLLPAPMEPGDDRFGPEISGIDLAYRLAIEKGIEQTDAGQEEPAITSQYWMLVGCRRCHIQARKNGLLPESGPLQPGE